MELPSWVQAMPEDDPLPQAILDAIRQSGEGLVHVRDVRRMPEAFELPDAKGLQLEGMDLGRGTVHMALPLREGLFYEVLGQKCGQQVRSDAHLMSLMTDLVKAKREYDRVASALESVEGKNDAEREERARVLLRQTGMDYDSYYANLLISAKEDKMEELLRGEIAELSDEELQAAYDAKVAEQEASYTDGSSFESAMTGDDAIVCWRPDGYRTVKHILLIPGDEIKSAYTDAVSALEDAQSDLDTLAAELEAANDGEIEEGERSAEEVQAEIDAIEATVPSLETAVKAAEQACLDDVKASTDEIYEKLEAGESFEDLIAEYGEDPGMQNEPTATRGYYVSAASTNWESNFRDAAMALNQVGEYTAEPVVSGSGVHIIRYESDVTAGPVALDEVRDALYEQTLTEKQEANVTDTIDAWVEAANPVVDVEAFEAAYTGEE